MFSDISATFKQFGNAVIQKHLTRKDFREYFDWPLLIICLAISMFGIVCIFSATSSEVTAAPATVMEMLQTQSLFYPSRQLINLIAGLAVLIIVMLPPYKLYEQFSEFLYWLNIALLGFTLLVATVGRGGMTAFLAVGSGDRSFQPSEIGKPIMIVCLAAMFAAQTKPVRTWKRLILYGLRIGFPTLLVILQPDVGTAMVYLAVFAVLLFSSGMDWSLFFKCIILVLLAGLVLWTALTNIGGSDNFRMTRIYIWLDPTSYPDEARQVINGQIAVGSGGLWGKGIISPGSFASLGYISDDHTDFIFSIVCESFGLVGGFALIGAYALLILRLIILSTRTKDPFGAFVLLGVMAMFLFHIVENICMVIGLTPVTGIPLPFVSYGGSNMVSNFAAIGLAENVVIHERSRRVRLQDDGPKPVQL